VRGLLNDRRSALAAIVLLALGVRLAGLGDTLTADEGYSWLVASAPDAGAFLDRLAAYENTPPLLYLLLAPLPLDDEVWLRLPVLIAAVASVPVLYAIVRPLLGDAAALLAALTLAVAPYHVSFSNYSRAFALATFALLLALWGAARLAQGRNERRWWLLYALGAVLALYSEYYAVLTLASIVAVLLVIGVPSPRWRTAALGALPLLALVPFAPEIADSLDAVDVSKIAPAYPGPGPAGLRDALTPLALGEHGAADSAALRSLEALVLAALAALAAAVMWRRSRLAFWLIPGVGAGTLVLHGALAITGPDIFAQRYLTFLIPVGAALFGAAIAQVRWRLATPAAAVALVALGAAVIVQRADRELEPDPAPVLAAVQRAGPAATIATNSATAAFYLRHLDPVLDRPFGIGRGCRTCAPPVVIVDDERAGGVRAGAGGVRIGPYVVRRSEVGARVAAREARQLNSLACSLAVILASFGGNATGRDLEVTFQDDALVLHRPASQVLATTRQIRALGGNRLRVTAGWSTLAPSPRSRKRPRFDASDPEAYPQDGWLKLDRAVKAARAAGLEVQIDIAFWAPRWAVRKKVAEKERQRWDPLASEYARFAEAVARRYAGDFPDPIHVAEKLPPVRMYTTWNEPNHATFLLPQWKSAGAQLVPASPHIYRKLHNAGYDAIKHVSRDNDVLIGGLAAIGSAEAGERRHMPPLLFLRELACVDADLRPLQRPACKGFQPLQADGFSHHPYSFGGPPHAVNPDPASAQLGDIERLTKLLDELERRGRIAGDLPLYLTEYGYETNPPDFGDGVSLEDQARYLGHASYLAWRDPNVRMFSQFLLRDIEPNPRYGPRDPRRFHDYQSGLLFDDGREKPAVQAFKLPFWPEVREAASARAVFVYGQVRPGEGRKEVQIEVRRPGEDFEPVPTLETRSAGDKNCSDDSLSFLTDRGGSYVRALPWEGEDVEYRPRWVHSDGSSEVGVPVEATLPGPRPVLTKQGRH